MIEMLNSFFKVINTHSVQMATICADAVQKVADAEKNHLDLKDIQIVSKVGGTLDDTELVDGLCIDQGALGKGSKSFLGSFISFPDHLKSNF